MLLAISSWHVAILTPTFADDRSAEFPRPVVIRPASPVEVVIGFDRPIAPASAAMLGHRMIEFETSNPKQARSIRIAGVRLEDDNRTIRLATDPHPIQTAYRLRVGEETWSYDLRGIEASWSEEGADPDAPPTWQGWLPVADLGESSTQIGRSAMFEHASRLIRKPGTLSLASMVTFPKGRIRVSISSDDPIEEFLAGDEAFQSVEGDSSIKSHELTIVSTGEPQFVSIRTRTTDKGTDRIPSLSLKARGENDESPIPLNHERFALPWAPIQSTNVAADGLAIPSAASLAGGDAQRGEALFQGDQAQCSRCHRVRGKGGTIGPDLSEIGKKGAREIYLSIANPSVNIEPDYESFTVSLTDGRVIAGIVRADGPDAINIHDTNAQVTRIERREIDQIRPASASIMPVGLASALGDERIKDLIAYLLSTATK
jgi:putative heme-binding domain-containing protein